jgi:argininosuccinate lyase
MSSRAWGGRFSQEPAAAVAAFSRSIDLDLSLGPEDVCGSRAHAAELVAAGVLTPAQGEAIARGLDGVARELAAGVFTPVDRDEDIHLAVERRLGELIGADAGRLHTGRSRNDQVAVDLRLRLRRLAWRDMAGLGRLMEALVGRAEAAEAEGILLPGYTHLQRAQPVRLAHHLLAHFEMLDRDRGRLADLTRRADVSPLGAAALAGTPHPIDPERTARALGFARASANSMDAVSDRDFVADYCYWASLTAVHLSRLAEEIVIFTSTEFAFWQLPDALAGGSSIMPQKKNPEPAEHLRGRAGTLLGVLTGFLATLKGLPLAYVSDLQESHRALGTAADLIGPMLGAACALVEGLQFDAGRMAAAAADPSILATDLADALARQGMPFRQAHRAVGRLVARAIELGVPLADLPADEIRPILPDAAPGMLAGMSASASADARRTLGGTAAERVRQALAEARRRLPPPDLPPLPPGLDPLAPYPTPEVTTP